MASPLRLEKINNLLAEETAKIINREMDFSKGILVTVTRVSTSTDMHYATVFVSIMGEDFKEPLEILQKNAYNIQGWLNKKLKMRPVPRIDFKIDEAEIQREKMEKTLTDLKQNGEL